ncbi:MAG: pyruvate ferredoxin oxidoreductase [Moorellales bacterium]
MGEKRELLTGNEAVAQAVRLVQPEVIAMYPITPQTPIVTRIAEMVAEGELACEVITAESEHAAMAACIAASLAGARVFTATSSQGLAYMHEMLHYASGSRVPVVMVNVNRALAAPWGFGPDPTDSLSQRDTGWIQIYCETGQEVLDTVVQAYRLAETVLLPVMVVMEGFYLSHTTEPVLVPEEETVRRFLAGLRPPAYLVPGPPYTVNNTAGHVRYARHRLEMHQAMRAAVDEAQAASDRWAELTGRAYDPIEVYPDAQAQTWFVALGALAGTVKCAVEALRDKGLPVGLVRVRLVRPFPVERLRRTLEGAKRVIVLDRACSPGLGGILAQEVRAALYGLPRAPEVYSWLAGVGGSNVAAEGLVQLGAEICRRGPAYAGYEGWLEV